MADTKITALTANTSPIATDIMPMVDDPGGTPATQKITLANLKTFFNDLATDAIWDAAGDIVQGTGANTGARLAIGTAGQLPRVNAGATALEYTTGGRVLISEQTPTGTGTCTWSSIPAGFKNLELEWVVRGTQAATFVLMLCYFNNDTTAANYRRTMDGAYAASSALHEGTDDARIAIVSAANAPANSAGRGRACIINYSGTAFYKNFTSSGGARVATSADQLYNYTCTAEWENTAAINRVDLTLSAGNFDTGSTLRLYGVY